MMDAVMYGMMPSENTEKFDSAPPVNRSSMVMDTPPLSVNWVSELVEGYAGNRHVGAEAVERKDGQREEDLLAQLRNLEGIDDRA